MKREMYSEVMNISNIEKINALFEDYKAKYPVCERPFKIKIHNTLFIVVNASLL